MKRFPNRESGLSRAVGGNEDEKEVARAGFRELFEHPPRLRHEVEESPEIRKLTEDINAHLAEFVSAYDCEPINIKPEHIHFFDRRQLPSDYQHKLEDEHGGVVRGFYVPAQQAIGIVLEKDSMSPTEIATLVAHEMIHFNSFQSVTVEQSNRSTETTPEAIRTNKRRIGLKIKGRDGKTYFPDFNEAVTEQLTQRFANEYFPEIPLLREELVRYAFREMEEVEKLRERFHEVVESSAEGLKDRYQLLLEKPATHHSQTHRYTSYEVERAHLNDVIDDLYEKNRDDFGSREDVFQLFAKAALGGRLLPLARLLEKTYGRGSFRKLGESEDL